MINIHLTNVEKIATADAATNEYFIDVVGNKTDASDASADTASLMALSRYIIANLSTDTDVAALLGALNSAAASGAVTDADVMMAYIKQLVTELQVVDGIVDNILVDTGELQTDWVNGGRLDLILDELTVQGDTNEALLTTVDSSGTFSYLDAGSEQDVVELTNSTRKTISAIWVDAINLTNNGTFKVSYKVDGTNYRELVDNAKTITAGTDEAINLISGNLAITEDLKVTYEEASDEGAARAIPFSVIYETKE